MITLPNLKAKVASYLQQTPGYFSINGVDLLLDAINQSYQKGQMDYDFELMKGVVDNSVTVGGGGVMNPSLLHGAQTVVQVKKLLSVSMQDPLGTGAIRPINFTAEESKIEDLRQRWKGLVWASDIRYPAYPLPMQGGYPPWIVQQGNNLQLYPSDQSVWSVPDTTTPIVLQCDAIVYSPQLHDQIVSTTTSTTTGTVVDSATNFLTLGVQIGDAVVNTTTGLASTVIGVAIHTLTLADARIMTSGNGYTVTSITNFLFTFGDQWLFWDAVTQLNMLVKEYVPRQEGNVPSPESQRDAAWARLLEWDSHIIGTGSTSFNLD